MIGLQAWLARMCLSALAATLRVEVVGSAYLESLRRGSRPILLAVWHGRMLVPILRHRGEGIVGLISASRDGDVAARALHGLGYDSVRGSSSRGGNAAFHALETRLAAGAEAAIVPDGPRGPARALKPGVVHLAQATGASILPLSAAARPARSLRSWDRFLLPLPFARAVIVYGAPVEVPQGLAPAALAGVRQGLEAQLTALEETADALVGARVEPLSSPAARRG